MIKGRKTIWKERIEIVQDCLESGKNYQKTAEEHQVSYQQAYQWVRKYEDRNTMASRKMFGGWKIK